MTPALRVDNLWSGYGPSLIVQGVSLDVLQGAITTVIGPNGAGKSTFIKTIVGLLPAQEGRIHLFGEDITNTAAEERVQLGVSYVPQLENVFPSLSVAENLTIMRSVATSRGSTFGDRMDAVFETFPQLVSKTGTRARMLSGGERQMLAMARALVTDPRLIVLDEPSAALSPSLVGEVFGHVERLRAAGSTILLIEQNVRPALAISDRVCVLESGRKVVDTDAKSLLADDRLEQLMVGGHLEEAD